MAAMAVLAGGFLALGLTLLLAGWLGAEMPRLPAGLGRRLQTSYKRAWVAAAIGLAAALATRWPVAAIACTCLAFFWPTLFGRLGDGRLQIERLDAIAVWTEALRDTMSAAVGLEQAIVASIETSPGAIRPQLERLDRRLRSHLPLGQALERFAMDFDDASVDLVVAALIMNAQLRGSGLVSTLTALAQTARDELDMRTRVEEARRNLRRNARVIIGVTVIFAGGLAVFSRTYLAPYGTATGQAVLALVVAMFAVGFWWIRNASDVAGSPRLLGTLDPAGQVGGRS